ncbi:hypothetical protein WAI453_005658 [Rhynchosporium graminicola]
MFEGRGSGVTVLHCSLYDPHPQSLRFYFLFSQIEFEAITYKRCKNPERIGSICSNQQTRRELTNVQNFLSTEGSVQTLFSRKPPVKKFDNLNIG